MWFIKKKKGKDGNKGRGISQKHGNGKRIIDRKTGEPLLLCPRCGIHMKKLVKDKITIDVCGKCGGMWADYGEVEKLNKVYLREVGKNEKKQKKRK